MSNWLIPLMVTNHILLWFLLYLTLEDSDEWHLVRKGGLAL